MMELSDQELWARIRAGDERAFGDFFERHAQHIFRFCFHRTASIQTAEDLMSTVFLETWRRRSSVPTDQPVPWLFGVAVNVVRNQNRSIRRHAAALARVAVPRPAPDIAEGILDRREVEHEMLLILDQLGTLTPLDQEVLALCVWQELSPADAAHALRVPTATVRTRLHRARQHLTQAVRSQADSTPRREP